MKLLLLIVVMAVLALQPARAAYVVQSCGALPLAYAAGATRDDVVDVNGNKCVSGTATVATGSVNIISTPAPVLGTTGGWTLTGFPGLTATIVSIKNSAPGQLAFLNCGVATPTTPAWIQLFDVATPGVATLGATAPKVSLAVPPGVINSFSLAAPGLQFSNGIQAAATSTATGSTAPASSVSCAFGSN